MRGTSVRRWGRAGGIALGLLVLLGAAVAVLQPERSGVRHKGLERARPGAVSAGPAGAGVSDGEAAGGGGADRAGQAAPVGADRASQVAPGADRASQVAPGGPRIVRTADLRVEVARGRFRPAFERAAGVATQHGGFVASSSSEGGEGRAVSGFLELRVPAGAFDAVRRALGRLGEVEEERIAGEDVGGQLVDLEARLRSLAVEEEALRTLMTKAQTVGETIQVQQQLSRVRQEIEQLQGRRAQLEDAVSFATVRVALAEPGAPAAIDEPNPLGDSVRRAVDGALSVVGGAIVVVGYALPLAVLAVLGWLAWRLLPRRRPVAS